MPRLKTSEATDRKTFIENFFRKNPDATGDAAIAAIKKATGKQMRADLVYKLRAKVRAESAPVATPATAPTEAATDSEPTPTSTASAPDAAPAVDPGDGDAIVAA